MKDQRGVDASSDNSQSLEIYERALRAFNTYRGDPVAIIDEGPAEAHGACTRVGEAELEGDDCLLTRDAGRRQQPGKKQDQYAGVAG